MSLLMLDVIISNITFLSKAYHLFMSLHTKLLNTINMVTTNKINCVHYIHNVENILLSTKVL